ncbi:MAG: hypothetical protein ACK417_04345 [Bacteroidia bacterium]
MKAIATWMVFGLMAVCFSLQSQAQSHSQVIKKSDIKSRQYVVMHPATDTIFGKIENLSFENQKLVRLVIKPEGRKKKMNLNQQQLQAVVGFSFFRPMELVQIKDDDGIRKDTWLNVLNADAIRLFEQKGKAYYEDDAADDLVEVEEVYFYWKFENQVFEITPRLINELIVPMMVECGGAELKWNGSLHAAELLRMTVLLNQSKDCFSFYDLN